MFKLLTELDNIPPDLTVRELLVGLAADENHKPFSVVDDGTISIEEMRHIEFAREGKLEVPTPVSPEEDSANDEIFASAITISEEVWEWEKAEFLKTMLINFPVQARKLQFELFIEDGNEVLYICTADGDHTLLFTEEKEDFDLLVPIITDRYEWRTYEVHHRSLPDKVRSDDTEPEGPVFRAVEDLGFSHDRELVMNIRSQWNRATFRKLHDVFLQKDYERGPYSIFTYGENTHLLYKGVNLTEVKTSSLPSVRKKPRKKSCKQRNYEAFGEHLRRCGGCKFCQNARA